MGLTTGFCGTQTSGGGLETRAAGDPGELADHNPPFERSPNAISELGSPWGLKPPVATPGLPASGDSESRSEQNPPTPSRLSTTGGFRPQLRPHDPRSEAQIVKSGPFEVLFHENGNGVIPEPLRSPGE
jgi:hypothetical protein